MKNHRPVCSFWLSVVGCWRNTKGLPFSYLPTLAFALVLTLLLAPPCLSQQRWQRTYGGTSGAYGYSVQQTQDGGYIVVGYTCSYGYSDVYLIKTDSNGDTLWTRTYGGAYGEEGHSVRQTQDSGYIVAGITWSFGNYTQVYLLKTNAGGDTLWTRNYGGMYYNEGQSVWQTSDGGYLGVGGDVYFGDSTQVYLIKTNALGDSLWTRTYGGTGDDWGYAVQQTSDGGYIVAGWTFSFGNGAQVYLIKTDSLGRSTGVEETTKERGQKLEVRMTVKPNPFTSFAKVPGQEKETFELYDIAGRRVGTYKGERIGWDTGPGVYFLRTSGKTTTPVRIVKVR